MNALGKMGSLKKEGTQEMVFVELWLLLMLQLWRGEVTGEVLISDLPRKEYVQLADINFGVIMAMSGNETACTDIFNPKISDTFPEVIAYAVELFNKQHPLPGNLTIGFVQLDNCFSDSVAASQALAFVPQTTCPVPATIPPKKVVRKPYDVVAVIGAYTSTRSIAIAQILGAAHVPQMGLFASSDELSDTSQFPYFLRLIPPDRLQIKVIYETIQLYGWTYVSVVYQEGDYGINAFKQLENLFDDGGVCLAVVRKIPEQATEEEVQDAADRLVNSHGFSRVVVIIMDIDNVRSLISAVSRSLPKKTFVWIGTDAWARFVTDLTDLGHMLQDSLVVDIHSSPVPEFEDRFNSLTPDDTINPWFREYWERLFNCSLDKGTCDANLTRGDASTTDGLALVRGYIMDTVFVIANATSRVLQSAKCSGLKGSAARDCVTGPRLLSELFATRQNGFSGLLTVNSNGDRQSPFDVKQLRLNSARQLTLVTISQFDPETSQWVHIKNISWTNTTIRTGFTHPESVCSFPCRGHEARLVQKVVCCWKCGSCKNNERLTDNGTTCELCGQFTWPDALTNRTTCALIPPVRLDFHNLSGYVQIVLPSFCILVCLSVFAFFHAYRDRRVIKASSLQLSYIMLFAIFLGYVTILTFMTEPTEISCRINFMMFSFSFTLIYGPLLLRTLWIYRIFEAGMKGKQRPPMSDIKHQLLFVFIIFFVQVVMIVVPMVMSDHWNELSELSRQLKYVEYTCHLPTESLVSFLVYNLLLVIVCAVLAFKTRYLPNNFNESRFISKCVCTNLIIYICFTPTYVISSRALIRIVILVLVLFLNHSIALVFLFLPKIYAVVFVPARELKRTVVLATNG